MSAIEPRPYCWACRRPQVGCLCATAEPFHSAVALTILEHRLEARSTIGTARIVRRFARDARVLTGNVPDFETSGELAARLQRPGWATAVLFPSPGSLDLSRCSPDEARAVFPPGMRPHVVVVDGTWNKASGILKGFHALHDLPRIAFSPGHASAYLFRRQPRPYCWSTLEATVEVLELLDRLGVAPAPERRAHLGLLDALGFLVDEQLRQARRGALRPERRRPGRKGASPAKIN